MGHRIVQTRIPRRHDTELRSVLRECNVDRSWEVFASDAVIVTSALVDSDETESLVDLLSDRFEAIDGFGIVILPVEGIRPRLTPVVPAVPDVARPRGAPRVSRDELYSTIEDAVRPSRVFFAMTIASAVVAAIGLMKSNIAVVVGAMVIAPLLGPNIGQALATTLGDFHLGRRAVRTNVLGLATALVVSMAIGAMWEVNPLSPEIVTRLTVDLSDVVLGLAAGSAGVFAVTAGAPASLVGVMVAVALMPPLVVTGMLLTSGEAGLAVESAKLLAVNVICVNLAGVATFLLQGVRPQRWWESDRARRATRWAVLMWATLLAALIALMV